MKWATGDDNGIPMMHGLYNYTCLKMAGKQAGRQAGRQAGKNSFAYTHMKLYSTSNLLEALLATLKTLLGLIILLRHLEDG